jgi:hypothetical protein
LLKVDHGLDAGSCGRRMRRRMPAHGAAAAFACASDSNELVSAGFCKAALAFKQAPGTPALKFAAFHGRDVVRA